MRRRLAKRKSQGANCQHDSHRSPQKTLGARRSGQIGYRRGNCDGKGGPKSPVWPVWYNAGACRHRGSHESQKSPLPDGRHAHGRRQTTAPATAVCQMPPRCPQRHAGLEAHKDRDQRDVYPASPDHVRRLAGYAQLGFSFAKKAAMPSCASALSQRATRPAMVSSMISSVMGGPRRRANALASATAPGATER